MKAFTFKTQLWKRLLVQKKSSTIGGFLQNRLFFNTTKIVMHSWLSCTLDCHALFFCHALFYCHALFTVMHFFLKTEDFVQKRLPILHFWLRKKVYSEQNPTLLVVSWHSSAAFMPNFWLFPSPTVQHCCKNTSKTLPSLFFYAPYQSWTFDGVAGQNLDLASVVGAFFFDPQSAKRCKNTSKTLPSLLFWCSPPVLQVWWTLHSFKIFQSQGSPLWIISRFW